VSAATASFARPSRGLLDLTAALLCLWAAAYHTPVGALFRSAAARIAGTHTSARPLLSYYSGGVYDTKDLDAPPAPLDLPDAQLLATIGPGAALGRGVMATTLQVGPEARESVDTLAARYHLGPVTTPDAAAAVVEKATAELSSRDAAVLAAFGGFELSRFAVERARAEGRSPSLMVLAARLPPSSAAAVEHASSALMLGQAYQLSWPVAPGTQVTSPFGWRNHPILGRTQFHTGVDLSVPEGTQVKAVADGVVRRASEDSVNGRVVIIDHGYGVSTAYCHNSRLRVFAGQAVSAGEVIADSGTTGRSTGPHVHYQVELGGRPTDPFAFRGARAVAQLAPLLPPAAPPLPPRGQGPLPPAPAASRGLQDAIHRAEVPPMDMPP
jgi:murein DD-endopeptidase